MCHEFTNFKRSIFIVCHVTHSYGEIHNLTECMFQILHYEYLKIVYYVQMFIATERPIQVGAQPLFGWR